jgi:aldehyde dehydrogenase (NAD+)
MMDKRKFYVEGAWINPDSAYTQQVINPATEKPIAEISLASSKDVDIAAKAARAAFPLFSMTSPKRRLELLGSLRDIYKRRQAEMAETISMEMGAPTRMAMRSQAAAGRTHLRTTVRSLRRFKWKEPNRDYNNVIVHEAIGVCGLITPWNWPMNHVVAKVAPALAAGCTIVLKPSELAPLSAMLFAEMIDEAGFPPGVFNLINGDGEGAGAALSAHPEIDMISFTGSNRAGKAVTIAAADTIKRVTMELGGKSPILIFSDTDVTAAVKRGVKSCFFNTGQSCNASTRMLVESSVYDQAVQSAKKIAEKFKVGDPTKEGFHIGPLANAAQNEKVQSMIASGIAQGATLLVGGSGKPDGFEQGYFVRPTIFVDVDRNMKIAREEIFGPVLCMMPFENEDEAIELANDTPYGLSAYLHTGNSERAKRLSKQLRVGMVQINGVSHSPDAPFGGYKQSGNGREFGKYGLLEFLEVKSISGL